MDAVLLEGSHPTLPRAELQALLDVHGGHIHRSLTERVHFIDGGRAALSQLVQHWGWGEHWGDVLDVPDGVAALADQCHDAAPGRLSIAVRSQRYGDDGVVRRQALERALGAALVERGHTVDLRRPEMEAFAWLGDGRLVAGRLIGRRDESFESRTSERRAHFSPVSLHPRRAAGLVHLARVPTGGRILDPFCGTGGIALEAALLGFDVWASDLDPWMVQGTLTTFTDVGPEPLDCPVFQADIGDVPHLVDHVDGIVTDLPYGGASTTHDEDIARLYDRAIGAFADILPRGGHAVIGHANPAILDPGDDFRVVERHAEYVHKSLTRHYAVLRRR